MKNIWKYLLLLISTSSSAQVNYEQSYFIRLSGALGQEFFMTNLGNNDYKYVIYDYDSAIFSLYNLDHSPFLLNVQIPVVSNASTNTYYRLGYITTSLFDCDSTNIEYAMMLSTPRPGEHPNFAIYRTDGTVLFSKDTVGTVFCVGCGSGSYEMYPIMNTSQGSKLYLFRNSSADSLEYLVYQLCGSLPETINEINQSSSFVRVFPNPSGDQINLEITAPSSYDEYELTIFNSSLQSVKTTIIKGTQNIVTIEGRTLSAGTYLYSLQGKNKIYQTGKFILSK